MRIIPKASKVRMSFYKGITIPDIIIGIVALAMIAVTLSTNFLFRGYIALGIFCLTVPLYLTIGTERLYIHIAHLFRYLFSRKKYALEKNGNGNIQSILPYREVKDGFIYDKDGSLSGVIKIEPTNFEMLSEEKQDLIIDDGIARILNSIGEGEEMFLLKVDEPLILDSYMAEELKRMDKISDYKGKGLLNEKEASSRIDICESRMNLIDEMNTKGILHPGYYIVLSGYSSKSIDEKLDSAMSILEMNGISSHRLKSQELHYFLVLGYGKNADPRIPMAKIACPREVKFTPFSVKQDNKQITNLVINKYPLTVPNGWMERLFSLNGTKVTMRIKPIEKEKAIKRIDHSILEIESKNVGKESEQLESDYHLDSLRDLLGDIQQSNQTLFDTILIVSAYDKIGETINKMVVKQALHEMGFGYTEMIGRQMEAYVSSLISNKELTKASYSIQTNSLAAGFPFQGDVRQEEKGLFLGENSLPAFIDFFKRDQSHVNSNMVILGQSGSGKSYATKTILTNLASDGARVFVLDPEAEYISLAKNLGGVSIDASNGLRQRINPFEVIPSLDEEGGTSNSFYSHLQFLEQFYKVVLPGINPDALEMLNKLTEEMYHQKGIGPQTDFLRMESKDYPTFEDLYSLAKSKLEKSKNSYDESCLRVLINYLSRFAKGGRDSALWNGYTTFSPKENFVDFNFQKLIANRNDTISNAQMLLLLKWLENEIIKNRDMNQRNHTDYKVVVAIDEAHLFIDEKYQIALDFMYSLAKRIRKYNGMLLIITQNVKDFMGTAETAKKSMAIINVSQYSMIFNLSPNDMNELLKLYENSGGFNEIEKDSIVRSSRGECFLISSPNERGRLFIEATDVIEGAFEG